MKKNILLLVSSILISGMISAQEVYYVDGSVSSSGVGTSWSTACKTIQEGINAAYSSLGNPTSETAQVWVREGVYYVYTNSVDNTINMLEGVEIYGGFNGTETSIEQRNFQNNITTIDGHQSSGSANQVKHVVTAYGNEIATDTYESWTNGLLDGFTVTGGNLEMSGPPKNGSKVTDPASILSSGDAMSGAGVLIFKSAPTIQNCIISNNSAGKGGGMYIMSATEFPSMNIDKASVKNCTFINNNAMMRGGGLAIDLGSEPIIEACKFLNNSCDAKGGGVYIDWVCPNPIFVNCLFAENMASRAGAIGVDGSSSPYLINCTITNNSSNDVGAGLYTGSYNADGTDSNEPTLINCIVSGNRADWGGPIDLRIWHDDYFYISHSIIGSGFTSFGDGISYETPVFNNIDESDYSLSNGSAGIDDGTASDALDIWAYIPTTDIDGNLRDANPDMGCYEYIITSISNNEINHNIFEIYPNPANDVINIQPLDISQNYNLKIHNNIGQAIIQQKCEGVYQLNVSDLSAGIYYISISNANVFETKKFVIE